MAALLLASMLGAALHDVSHAWDVWYYHLPFAGRLSGVVPPEAFVFHAANQARFDGFPLFGERLQGRCGGSPGAPECANLVAFAERPALRLVPPARASVPPHLSVLGLFAVPLVQAHATIVLRRSPRERGGDASLVLLAIRRVRARGLRLARGALGRSLGIARVAPRSPRTRRC